MISTGLNPEYPVKVTWGTLRAKLETRTISSLEIRLLIISCALLGDLVLVSERMKLFHLINELMSGSYLTKWEKNQIKKVIRMLEEVKG